MRLNRWRPGRSPLLSASTALVLAMASVAAGAANVYVATTGSDTTGNGSLAAPYATLQRAYTAAAAGDSIILRQGTYQGGLLVKKANISFSSYPGERATLSLPHTAAAGVGSAGNVIDFNTGSDGGSIHGLTISGGQYYNINLTTPNHLVEDCLLDGAGYNGIKIQSESPGVDDVTVRRCEICRVGQNTASSSCIDDVNGDRMVVQDCYLHDSPSAAVVAKGGATDCVIERNLVANCQLGILLGQYTGVQFFDNTQNPFNYENIDGIARNNVVVNCLGEGIGVYSAYHPVVANNTLCNVAQTMQAGICVWGTMDWRNSPATPKPCVDPTIVNNIVYVRGNIGPPINLTGDPASVSGTVTVASNVYHREPYSGNYPNAQDHTTWPPAAWPTTWQQRYGDPGSTIADPQLDASFGLTASSPCIGAGQVVPYVTDDFNGTPRGATNDIGAIQYDAPLVPNVAVDTTTGTVGQTVALACSLAPDPSGAPASGRNISLVVDGTPAGNAITDASGSVQVPFQIPASLGSGVHNVTAWFDELPSDTYNPGATFTAPALYVRKAGISFSLYTAIAAPGQSVTLRTLVYSGGAPVSGIPVQFAVDGAPAGSGVSDATGAACVLSLPTTTTLGYHTVTVSFAGNNAYTAQTRTGSALYVHRNGIAFSLRSASGSTGQTVTLHALVYSLNAPVSGIPVQFAVDGTAVGTGVSDSTGTSCSFTIPASMASGSHNVTVSFPGNAVYYPSTRTGAALTVK